MDWEVYADSHLHTRVMSGTAVAEVARNWCCKLDIRGLTPDTDYWYRFRTGNEHSDVGHFRTSGWKNAAVIAAVTCTNPAEGHLNTYEVIADDRDIDVVVHMGDYIYEYGSPRVLPAHRCVTLADYRERHGAVRSEPHLAAAHRQHAWIVTWDDGDIWNNISTNLQGGDHDPVVDGDPRLRKDSAVKAWFEWVPVRDAKGGLWGPAVHRSLAAGNLIEFAVMDLRLDGRDPEPSMFPVAEVADSDYPSRRMISDSQLNMVTETLHRSEATWKFLLSPAPLAHWGTPGAQAFPSEVKELVFEGNAFREFGVQAYTASWNGYPDARRELFERLDGVSNLVSIAGDSHMSFVKDLTHDPYNPALYDPRTGRGAFGVEFEVPSASSAAVAETCGWRPRTVSKVLQAASLAVNPHHKFCELDSKGYAKIAVTHEGLEATYVYVDSVETSHYSTFTEGIFRVDAGRPFAYRI